MFPPFVVYREEQQRFSFPLITWNVPNGKVRGSWRWLRFTHRARYKSSVNCFFSILLSGDCYRAISRHWIIIVSTRFSTFASLIRAISTHWIILYSPYFSTFTSLVQFRLFSTSPPWAVWRKASAQSGIMSRSSSAGLLHSPFVSGRVEIFLSFYDFPNAHAILVITPPAYV